jgi:hypothetical protein
VANTATPLTVPMVFASTDTHIHAAREVVPLHLHRRHDTAREYPRCVDLRPVASQPRPAAEFELVTLGFFLLLILDAQGPGLRGDQPGPAIASASSSGCKKVPGSGNGVKRLTAGQGLVGLPKRVT